MKFAHIADCHVGSWREPKLRELNYKSFSYAIDEIIREKVDFLLVAGDLFNTSFPAIDALKLVVSKFKELKNNNIPVYYIAGSHDFSPSGKTMLDVIEEADLAKDVMRGDVDDDNKLHLKFTVDEKTGAKITGILGKAGMLDRKYYESLEREFLEKEDGFKIFMFHTAISELKPKNMEMVDAAPISLLPKKFDYYAGGHVHIVHEGSVEGYNNVIYPGPIFPNSFSEVEELGQGSFYIYNEGSIELRKIEIMKHEKINIKCKDKPAEKVNEELFDAIKDKDYKDTIVTIKLSGKLSAGRLSDIDFKELFHKMYERGAYFVMKSTSSLTTHEFEEIKISSDSVENIEDSIIDEHLGQMDIGLGKEKEKEFTKNLINTLNAEKNEGEKIHDYEERVRENVNKILDLL